MTGASAVEAFRALFLAAFPGAMAPRLAVCRVVRDVAGKLSLQPVDGPTDEVGNMKPVEVWPGVPGATSDPAEGELVVVAFVGADQRPCVIARVFEGGPGWPPESVYHDAKLQVRLIASLASKNAKVIVGSDDEVEPRAVAIALPVGQAFGAVVEAFGAVLAYATAVAAAVPATAPAQASLSAALGPLLTSIAAKNADYPVGYHSTNLEAK
jgi:hypothetical protein